jgi:predicted nucleic acid-binding protein
LSSSSPSYLFDASALVNLVVSRAGDALDAAKGHNMLDLTVYEAGNSLWKLNVIHKQVGVAEATSLLLVVGKLSKRMNVLGVSQPDLASVLELAVQERTSFYDAAYVHAARERGLELVTDDARLKRVASKFVKTRSSSDL